MAVLFFLPWVTCSERVELGAMSLLPYERGRRPGPLGAVTQSDLDAILAAYANRSYGIKTGQHGQSGVGCNDRSLAH